MKQNRLAIMAIPVLAAVLIGGSIAPAAYADHQNNAECGALAKNFFSALAKGQINKALAILNAAEGACFDSGAECTAHFDNLIRALDAGDLDRASQQFELLIHHEC